MKSSCLCITLLLVFAACSRKTDTELYGEGKTAQSQKNFQLAIDRYQEVVDRYPKSAYAESSLYRMAALSSNDLHDTRRAIQAYQELFTMFPASREAPNALFLVGFLYNNELHNIDSAKIAYETFLREYPTNSLASSAKYELQTLGKDPTVLLQSRTETKGSEKTGGSSNASKQ